LGILDFLLFLLLGCFLCPSRGGALEGTVGSFLCPSKSGVLCPSKGVAGASEGTRVAFLCPSKGGAGASEGTRGGASERTRGISLCPTRDGASEERGSCISSVVGSAMASSAEQIGLKNGDLHGGGGREGVWVAPKYTNALGFWKAECPW
jgi:hypothetical protein